jgi:hypothetical protein
MPSHSHESLINSVALLRIIGSMVHTCLPSRCYLSLGFIPSLLPYHHQPHDYNVIALATEIVSETVRSISARYTSIVGHRTIICSLLPRYYLKLAYLWNRVHWCRYT